MLEKKFPKFLIGLDEKKNHSNTLENINKWVAGQVFAKKQLRQFFRATFEVY